MNEIKMRLRPPCFKMDLNVKKDNSKPLIRYGRWKTKEKARYK